VYTIESRVEKATLFIAWKFDVSLNLWSLRVCSRHISPYERQDDQIGACAVFTSLLALVLICRHLNA
jgi:hypothetical protein